MNLIRVLTGLAVVSIVVAVAIPNQIQARKHGNETLAIGALKTIATSDAISARATRTVAFVTFELRHENTWRATRGEDPRSTFSIDVDTASYANVRRFLDARQLPPTDAVRDRGAGQLLPLRLPAAAPTAARRSRCTQRGRAVPVERRAPAGAHRPARAREIARDERPPRNLVFLIDVSGSMDEPNKLPLREAVARRCSSSSCGANDRVAHRRLRRRGGPRAAADAGDREAARSSTRSTRLEAGGSTNGGGGHPARVRGRARARSSRAASTA